MSRTKIALLAGFGLSALACSDAPSSTLAVTWTEPLGTPAVMPAKNPRRDVDCNGDGYADLVTIDTMKTDRTLTFIPGGPNGLRFAEAQVAETPGGNTSVLAVRHVGDVNGDGFSDFVVGSEAAGATDVRLYLCSASGLPERPSVVLTESVPLPRHNPPSRVGAGGRPAGDLNGDGIGDLIIERYMANVAIHYGSKSGISSKPNLEIGSHPEHGQFHAVLPVGDLDRDGFADLLLVWRTQFDEVRVTLHRGSLFGVDVEGALQPSDNIFFWFLTHQSHKALDFDGDGVMDIVGAPHPEFPHADLVRSRAFWFRGDSIGFFGSYRLLLRWKAGVEQGGMNQLDLFERIGTDIDGDGVMDVLGHDLAKLDEATNTMKLIVNGYKGGPDRTKETETTMHWNHEAEYTLSNGALNQPRRQLVCPGDIDGDGFFDCVVLAFAHVFGVRGSPEGPRPVLDPYTPLVPARDAATRSTLADPLYR